jgi:hypothetical protein
MKNKVLMPFLIFIFISIIVFLGLFSCSSDTTKPQNLEELEKPFGIPHSEKPAIPKSFNIIVDASASMYGFTGKNSGFLNLLNTIIAKIPQDAKINFYSFGQGSLKMEGNLRANLYKLSRRDFYKESRTDLTKPFNLIREDKNSVNIILTDGVQSTQHSQEDYVIFAKELNQYLEGNGFFALMGKQVPFEGSYFSEYARKYIDIEPGGKRPIYCLAFGNRKYADFVQKKIRDLFDNCFDFGVVLPNHLKYTQDESGKNEPEKLVHISNDEKLPVAYFNLGKGHFQYLKFNLKGYEDRFGTTIDYAVAYQAKKNPNFIELQDKRGTVKANKFAGTDKITFKIPFEEDKSGTYRILLSFRKTLPSWIKEWSTDDDSKPELQTKTYHLANWMQFILDNFEDYKFLTTTRYYLQIERK